MTMLIAPPAEELVVEAGGTVESWLTLSDGEGDLRIVGLPSAWFTMSMQQAEPPRVLLVVHPPAIEHGGEPGAYEFRVTAGDVSIPMRLRIQAPGMDGGRPSRSRLIDFLPRHYHTDEFLGRFLLIFQAALDRIERSIDNTHFLLDPGLAPPEFLNWLANWLDLDLTGVHDTATQRALIERAVELYRWKGTRRGLRAELALRLNARALIVENFDGLRLGHDAAMGINTHIGRRRDGCMSVTVAGDAEDLQTRVEDLLENVKPAGSGFIVRRAPERAGDGEN
jgi:phage tail-like protein